MTIQDIPDSLVGGGVTSFTLAGPKLFGHVNPYCPPLPPNLGGASAPTNAGDPVTISRIPTYGGPARTLFSRNDPRAPGVCNPYQIRSNIVADATYVYWVDSSGLVRLTTTAPRRQRQLLHQDRWRQQRPVAGNTQIASLRGRKFAEGTQLVAL